MSKLRDNVDALRFRMSALQGSLRGGCKLGSDPSGIIRRLILAHA